MLEEYAFDVDAIKSLKIHCRISSLAFMTLILDIKMPKIDGFRLCEQIKRIDREVCFITASEEYYKEHFSELKKEGCFMQKPISLDDLVNRINLVLSNQ
jgi:DNA-binding response OmpR family regulator